MSALQLHLEVHGCPRKRVCCAKCHKTFPLPVGYQFRTPEERREYEIHERIKRWGAEESDARAETAKRFHDWFASFRMPPPPTRKTARLTFDLPLNIAVEYSGLSNVDPAFARQLQKELLELMTKHITERKHRLIERQVKESLFPHLLAPIRSDNDTPQNQDSQPTA